MPTTTIAITTEDDKGLESQISNRFGKSPYYVVVKMAKGSLTDVAVGKNGYFEGNHLGLMPATHGKGIKVILAGSMEPRVVGMFHDLGIDVVTGLEGTAAQALHTFIEQKRA